MHIYVQVYKIEIKYKTSEIFVAAENRFVRCISDKICTSKTCILIHNTKEGAGLTAEALIDLEGCSTVCRESLFVYVVFSAKLLLS